MKVNQLNAIKSIYGIIFNVLNIYDDILKEVMEINFNKEISRKDLLTKMKEMIESTSEILRETQKILSSISQSPSELEKDIILNDESNLLKEFQEEGYNRLISLVKDSIDVMDILIAYIIKTSPKENIQIENIFNQSQKKSYENVENLILKDEKTLYKQLINKIKTNIFNINEILEDLSKIEYFIEEDFNRK